MDEHRLTSLHDVMIECERDATYIRRRIDTHSFQKLRVLGREDYEPCLSNVFVSTGDI